MAQSDIRKWLNDNQKWLAAVLVILIAGILWWMWRSTRATPRVAAATKYYFYDTSTRQLSVHPADELPPLKNAAGKAVIVRAVFLTCTSCGNRKLAYLLKYTAAAQAAEKYLIHPPGSGAPQSEVGQFAAQVPTLKVEVADGTLIRLPTPGSKWVGKLSPQGAAILQQASKCPGNQYAQPCLP